MAECRERPYPQFNFLVELGSGAATDTPQAGFQEVSGLGAEVNVTEYRNGNYADNARIKITTTNSVPDVTLRRGVIGSKDLFEWLDAVRSGAQDALRTVTIQLQSEDHSVIAMEWKLKNARPISYNGPSLNGAGTDLAIEELVLACERIEVA